MLCRTRTFGIGMSVSDMCLGTITAIAFGIEYGKKVARKEK